MITIIFQVHSAYESTMHTVDKAADATVEAVRLFVCYHERYLKRTSDILVLSDELEKFYS